MSELINYRDGRYNYKGAHTTSQVEGVEEVFRQFLVSEKFDAVFEIGTLQGGLTHIINDIKVENNLKFKITTIDYSIRDWLVDTFKNLGIEYLYYDETTEEFKAFIVEYIKNNKKVCILCDGGNKIDEFKMLAPYLKEGDFIMCHDYVQDKITFKQEYFNKIWNFHEVELTDLQETVEKYNLVQYRKVDFQSKVWVCFQKI